MGTTTGRGPVLVRVLGPVQAWRGPGLAELRRPQQQLALAALALRAGSVLTQDELVDVIWDRPCPTAAGGVHKVISWLRAALEPGTPAASARLLVRTAGGYQLRLPPAAVDEHVFGQHRHAARRARASGDAAGAAAHLDAALGLWHGTALSGLPGRWAHAERDRLAEARLSAVEERVSARLELGCHADLTAELTGLTARHPLRETLWAQLMLARYRSGQRGQALRAYTDARRILARELGTDPGPPLRALHQQILRDDPALTQPRITPGQLRLA